MPKDEWDKARRRDIQRQAAGEFASGADSSFDFLWDDPETIEWVRGRRVGRPSISGQSQKARKKHSSRKAKSLKPDPKEGPTNYTGSRKAGQLFALRLCVVRTRQKTRLRQLQDLLKRRLGTYTCNPVYDQWLRRFLIYLRDYHDAVSAWLRGTHTARFVVVRGGLTDALVHVRVHPDKVVRAKAVGIIEAELVYHLALSELLSTIRNRAWIEDSVVELMDRHIDASKNVRRLQRERSRSRSRA